MQKFSRFILRKTNLVAFVGTFLAGIGAYYSVLLYQNLRTDIEELLPTDARSVLDLNEVRSRLESIDNLAVLIFSDHTEASKRFVIDLASALKDAPKDLISSVDYRISKELEFFKARQALFMDLKQLKKIKNYVQARIDYETSLYNPLNIFRSSELVEPSLDLAALKGDHESDISSYTRFPDGFYATPDEKKRVVQVNISGQAKGIHGQLQLKDKVVQAVQSLNPSSYAPDLQILYAGGVEDSIEEQAALVEDLEVSTVIVTVIVTLGMLLFYKAIRATLALLMSLFMGTFWTFGLSYYFVGYLNANSAFLGSIVIGNGINFGIIYLARYLEERRSRKTHAQATQTAMVHTATSTGAAALAAGLSYGSLILTGFRGFRQFGIIGLMGMILCWISAFTLLPAYLGILDRFKPLIRPGAPPPRHFLANVVARFVGKFPKTIWMTSVIATIVSIFLLARFDSSVLETDLSKLRNKESITRGSAYLSKYLDEIFQRYLSPLVVLPHSRENARRVAQLLKDHKEHHPNSMISSVRTLDDFVPSHQKEKIELLKQIKDLLPPRIYYRLPEKEKALVDSFLTKEALKELTEKDLPPMILRLFTERDGTVGKMVLVEPPLTHVTWQGNYLIQFIDELREAADQIESDAPVAGTMAVSSDMIRAISQDGPKATLFAFLAVVILVIVLFRNIKTISLSLAALFIGVLWLAGIILGFKLKINFLNFIALPITFGIGVDYGVNVFQRYKEQGGKDILGVIRNTGSAVGLCSFSTIVGYTSLLIAGNQGFVSFGFLAVAGEMTCLIAALISLPAYLLTRKQKI